MKYHAKKLINGWSLNYFNGKKYVAVPEKYDEVGFDGEIMNIKGKEPVTTREFSDKFGRGNTYMLRYYEWSPEVRTLFT